ncbi:MAG: hypothetical protein CVU88_04800 [Firmicutes bacterium HGW-Firmicutes-13]|nr:MAG: hypothetical protein CVU88_04800 [Firmicutes bacterium HGW-Firmicutes-13]
MTILKVGQLVCSKAGRDKGDYYIVTKIIDSRFVQAANGSSRKLNSSKKKNKKHLIIYPYVDEEIGKIIRNKKVNNGELVKAFNKLLQKVSKQDNKGGFTT